jgi:hypothetical protein
VLDKADDFIDISKREWVIRRVPVLPHSLTTRDPVNSYFCT